jgi:hypothetical protein
MTTNSSETLHQPLRQDTGPLSKKNKKEKEKAGNWKEKHMLPSLVRVGTSPNGK